MCAKMAFQHQAGTAMECLSVICIFRFFIVNQRVLLELFKSGQFILIFRYP